MKKDKSISQTIKPWRGWKKIEKSKTRQPVQQKRKGASEESKIIENPLDPRKLKKINKRAYQEHIHEQYAKNISRLDEIKRETICEYSGDTITQDAFVVYAPHRKLVSRRVRQSRNHCKNCSDPINISRNIETDKYCDPCTNQGICSCVKQERSDRLQRLEGKRGLYCENCVKGPWRCAGCDVPMPAHHHGLNLCPFCASSSIREDKRLTSLHIEVESFFFELDLEHPTLEYKSELIDKSWDKPIGISEAMQIHNQKILVDGKLPELNYLERILWHYAHHLASKWKKINDPHMINITACFFVFLFFENQRYYQQAQKQKKLGFSLSKTFQPLYQAYFKLGVKNSYQYLKEKLK